MALTQYHLCGKGFSGRAVRLRDLDPMEVENNLLSAAKLAGQDATIMELKKIEWRKGAQAMLVEFTEPCTDPMAPDVKWKKVTPGMLDDMGRYFKAKDQQALEAIYRDYHEAVTSEIDEITKKAVPVSEG